MSSSPLVSVVIATYNRSRVLAHAIESVRRSSLTDFELVVVGDCCTDDTAAVVASFGDARTRFVNLPRNVGEQSGPHNEGLRIARGRYISFLNHDDLYFPDHLASAVAFLERSKAALVWAPVLVALPASEADRGAGRSAFRLSGVPVGDEYDPRVFVFASAWLLTRELAAAVGPWRPARETFVSSSQDWLFRAWRSGARLRFLPRATVLAVPAGARQGSYRDTTSAEHEYFAREMQANPRFRDLAIESAAITGERETNRHRLGHASFQGLRGLLFRPVAAAAIALGMPPQTPYFALRYGRKGNLISAIRRRTGLDELS